MILRPILRLLAQEHLRRPIEGDLVSIGRQTVPMTSDEAKEILRQEGLPIRDVTSSTFVDADLYALFCDVRLRSLDQSDYEGADIIHDLTQPLPFELHGIADFVFDGSCLDNIFDPACAMRCFADLLRPGGRMFCYEHGTMIQGAYVVFSEEWFRDFLTFNGFLDISVISYFFDGVMGEWGRNPKANWMIIAIATKGKNRTTGYVSPIQAIYRK